MDNQLDGYQIAGIVAVVYAFVRLIEKGLSLITNLITKLIDQRKNNVKEDKQDFPSRGCTDVLNLKVSKEVCDVKHDAIKEQLSALFRKAEDSNQMLSSIKTSVAVIEKGVNGDD